MDESIVKHLDAPSRTLRLSEAIRIGARMRPQCFGEYFVGAGSCALGAAWEGMGMTGTPPRNMLDAVRLMGFPDAPTAEIADRNDAGRTREQIADWLSAQGL